MRKCHTFDELSMELQSNIKKVNFCEMSKTFYTYAPIVSGSYNFRTFKWRKMWHSDATFEPKGRILSKQNAFSWVNFLEMKETYPRLYKVKFFNKL